MFKYILFFVLLVSTKCVGQEIGTFDHDTTCTVLKLTKKCGSFKERKRMDTYSPNGFYIYLNYCYNFSYRGNDKYFMSRVIKISKDSIWLTSDFNETMASVNKHTYDTAKIGIDELEKIKFIRDQFLNIREKINLKDFDKQLVTTSKCYESPIAIALLNSPKENTNCFAYCAGSNIYYCYEEKGKIYASNKIYYGDGK